MVNEPARPSLSAGLAHELRTPLNQIIGYSEMLLELAGELRQEEFLPDLEKVCVAGQRLLAIILENSDDAVTEAPKGGHATNSPVDEALGTEFRRLPPELETGPNGSKGSLLAVDDNAGNRDVLSRRLKKQGYAVTTAASGLQALQMLEAAAYDLVLLDIMMPGLDGYEVLRRMKADDRLRRVPVIMISASGDMESVARCIEMGAEDYLTKPFNPTLLQARLSACLEKKRGRDREMHLFEQLEQNYRRLQELEGLRDNLTHMIVHDLRTPLTSVMAAMQTLDVVGDVNEAQREIMDIAVTGSDALLTMINSLLDVEKFESGAMGLEYALISLPELSASAVAQVSSLALEKNITVVNEVGTELPLLNADASKLKRVLVNLLGNAVKFTSPAGFVTLSARLNDDHDSVEFCVQDTGEGIPAEAFERIFQKFGQVDSRAGGRSMSTGLGLTFCKLAVEAHGGQIHVESVLLEGSKFFFTIPVSAPRRIAAA